MDCGNRRLCVGLWTDCRKRCMDGGMRIGCGKRCMGGGDANKLWKAAFVQWDADGLRKSELELRKNGGRCALLSSAVRAFVEKNLSGGAE